MLQTSAPTPLQGNPQPPADWLGLFSARLVQLRPDADPEESFDLAAQLWAVQNVTPESAAEIVSTLMPDEPPIRRVV
jgi:hypothetical protein